MKPVYVFRENIYEKSFIKYLRMDYNKIEIILEVNSEWILRKIITV